MQRVFLLAAVKARGWQSLIETGYFRNPVKNSTDENIRGRIEAIFKCYSAINLCVTLYEVSRCDAWIVVRFLFNAFKCLNQYERINYKVWYILFVIR